MVNSDYKADLIYYEVNSDYKAKGDALWYFVDQEYKADKKIYNWLVDINKPTKLTRR